MDDVIEYMKKLIELLKLHVNENKRNPCISEKIIPLMSKIPVDIQKA